MARITSKHDATLSIPSGPVLRPGATVWVGQWDVLKEHAVVKAWVDPGLIEEEPQDPLDHDGDGRKGGSLPKSKRD